jgi:hypothetical protein
LIKVKPDELEQIMVKMLSTLGDELQCLSDFDKEYLADKYSLTIKQINQIEYKLSKLFARIVLDGRI